MLFWALFYLSASAREEAFEDSSPTLRFILAWCRYVPLDFSCCVGAWSIFSEIESSTVSEGGANL